MGGKGLNGDIAFDEVKENDVMFFPNEFDTFGP